MHLYRAQYGFAAFTVFTVFAAATGADATGVGMVQTPATQTPAIAILTFRHMSRDLSEYLRRG
ncbi:hypothetical protein GCM10023074_26610 [Microbispora amethystogenes]|uniref:Uncharacterized protein n=1 Tax=Microbispora amethystogenes TaxID=1427754 RepID=A0ABQ4F9E3_9ACTN|nr:hypothetical protein Mam01_16100 [Microbispora amethystogenes]